MGTNPHIAHYPAQLHIDLAIIRDNYRDLVQLGHTYNPSVLCAAVVKANAYGLGMKNVALSLWQAGCRLFFVAQLQEGVALRQFFRENILCQYPEPPPEIAVFQGVMAGEAPAFCEYQLLPVLNHEQQWQEWGRFCAQSDRAHPAILHIDTGMNRLGFDYTMAQKLSEKQETASFPLRAVMSHLACADMADHKITDFQQQRFQSLRALFPHTALSLANSAGIFRDPALHYDILRPGCALYGINPLSDQKLVLKQPATLLAPICQVRNVQPGDCVGYGGGWTAQKDSLCLTIACGYADGYLRHSGAAKGHNQNMHAKIWFRDHFLPVIGRISMDLIVVDATSLRNQGIDENSLYGEYVEIMGPHITVNDVAHHAGTIGYEVLTRLGERWERRYYNQDSL